MDTPGKADPAIYPKLREHMLQLRLPNLPDGAIHAVLMDWPVTNGMMTALAATDGTASLYLSSGGGFLGGGQKYPAIREAALNAVEVAGRAFAQAPPAAPPGGQSTITSTSTLVIVPTLVRSTSGDLVYGLKPEDFLLTDNGVEQKISIEEVERQPLAVVVLMQTGGAAPRH